MKLDDFLGQKTASRFKIWKGQCCWGILLCHSLSIGTVSPWQWWHWGRWESADDARSEVFHSQWSTDPGSHLKVTCTRLSLPRPPPTRSKPASHSTVQPQSWIPVSKDAERDWTSQIMFWRYRVVLLPGRGVVVNIGQLRELQHEVDSTVHK